ncbi:hypothetical protein BC830DRAFT_1168641 [Chytriomyces sp. MP71]|nr:hypothetical protein BC830DRAFT_1168641 [Chytriomyces sp. MP71]
MAPQPPPQQYENELDDPIYARRETFKEKFYRRNMENPLVIPTVGVCLFSLYLMMRASFRGDARTFQNAQRLRVGAQGVAIVMASATVVLEQTKKQRRLEELQAAATNAPSQPESTKQ